MPSAKFLQQESPGSEAGVKARHGPVSVPIRALSASHRPQIVAHLLSLSDQDRYLRFGYLAHDVQIEKYVAGIDFGRDDVFGIYNRRLVLLAVAHLARAQAQEHGYEACAEFGVSVLPEARGRGYGASLFKRAATHAMNEGIRMMFIHALSENGAMLSIARAAGATVVRDGAESDAYLALDRATLDSRMGEALEEQLARTDYHLKVQARQFWHFLEHLQEARRGSIEADSPPLT